MTITTLEVYCNEEIYSFTVVCDPALQQSSGLAAQNSGESDKEMQNSEESGQDVQNSEESGQDEQNTGEPDKETQDAEEPGQETQNRGEPDQGASSASKAVVQQVGADEMP